MQTITINVVDKVATAEGNPFIVCGNSDYTILFNFDKAWNGYNAKTARFSYEQDGEEIIAEVPFAGNSCKAPVIHNTKRVFVGVYAGDILSTTRCGITCKASILDGEGIEHEDPPEDIYNQIVEICNEAVTAAGEAEAAAAGFEATTRETFANAIKGNLYGAAVRADDVSPVEHNLACKVESKNLIPYPYAETTITRGGLTFTDNGDGSISVKGTVTDNFATFNLNSKMEFVDGVTYFIGNSPNVYFAYKDTPQATSTNYILNSSFTWSRNYSFVKVYLQYTKGDVVDEVIKPMLSVGSTATEYTPYIDPATAKVKRCGKNLIPYPYQDKTKSYNGISYQDNGNGSITVSGTSAQQSNFAFTTDNFNIKQGVTYTLSLKGDFKVDNYLTLYIHSSKENRTIASLITTASKALTFKADKDCTTAAIYIVVPAGRTISGTFIPQLEIGTTETDYEPYIEPDTYTPNADGTVEGIISISPSMALLTDTAGTVINCEYNRDSNKALTGSNNNMVTAEGTVVSPNADFAEVAEWADGNPDNEDRTGYFVCANVPVNGIIMRKATSIDDVKGVSIQAPAFAGNYTKDKLDSTGRLLPKYSYVAIIGFVPVRDNGTCTVGGRCMPDDNGCAIPSSNSMGYQVVNRIDENRVLIIIEPNGDMVQRVKTKINEINQELDEKVSKDVANNTFAPSIACESSGDIIALNDASERNLSGLNVYGKTTQAGTPSPENPQGLESPKDVLLKVNGANILPDDFWDFNSGKWTATGDYYLYHLDIPDGTTITLSAPHSTGELAKDLYVNIGLAVSNSKMWLYHPTSTTLNHNAITVTAENGEGIYIRMYLPKNYLTALREAGLWVNIGTETQLYEPYTEQSLALPILNEVGLAGVPVNSGGNYTDVNGQAWICDEIDFARGVYIQRIRACEFKKTNWKMDGTEEANDWKFGINVGEKSINKAIMCKQFPLMTNVANGHKNGCGINIWGNGYLEIVSTTHTTAEAFNEWNRNNPINILYALAEPIETPLDGATLSAFSALHTNKPNTTIITSVGAWMSTEYVADTKLYIDKKFAELQALILEG